MTPLEVVKLVNTGTLLWETVGQLVERSLETGEDISMDDVEAASVKAGQDLDTLRAAIAAKRAGP